MSAPETTASRLAQEASAALAAGSPLAASFEAFTRRPAQQRLAAAIATTLSEREVLLAEAGTGTGKTFAYLVPVLLSGMRTIISTGTRALQDQLFLRDLPRVRAALGVDAKVALLKGRANYLCHYRMEQALADPRFHGGALGAQLQAVLDWSKRTHSGDLAELDALPEDSPLLPQITSTAENCLGTTCPFWNDCFVVRARQRAQAADVVVVNHHLLLADLALKEEGFGEVLPGAQAFVVDEAHQLPELAAQFFGEGMGLRALLEIGVDALTESANVDGALAVLQQPVRGLDQAARAARAAMDPLPSRGTARRALAAAGVAPAFAALQAALLALRNALEPLREAAPGFDACHLRTVGMLARLERWLQVEDAAEPEPEPDWAVDAPAGDDVAVDSPSVHWYELTARGFRLQRTPLDVSGPLRAHRERTGAAWVFTSATLTVAGRFDHVARRLGIDRARELCEPSPFDWEAQALCYLPNGLPDPGAPDYTRRVVDAVTPVLTASGGRAFLLFASHRALREAEACLRGGPWPLFVQGSEPRHALLQHFRASGSGVLLGTASFREGVDVAGAALSVVVIDKLPFAAPDDPVFEARLEAIRRAGGNPFRDEQLPQAVIAFKQGAGRLIRTETDRGVLVLCDPRLRSRSYGRTFLASLPPLPVTDAVDAVIRFFAVGAGSRTGP